MTMLCNRCELLFNECRPLVGRNCGRHDLPLAPSDLPRTALPPSIEAVAMVDHRYKEMQLKTVLVVDFYWGNP